VEEAEFRGARVEVACGGGSGESGGATVMLMPIIPERINSMVQSPASKAQSRFLQACRRAIGRTKRATAAMDGAVHHKHQSSTKNQVGGTHPWE